MVDGNLVDLVLLSCVSLWLAGMVHENLSYKDSKGDSGNKMCML